MSTSNLRSLRPAWPVIFLLATGCDVPTETPWWETRWVLPGEDTRLDPESFLPGGMTVSGNRSVFLVDIEEALDGRTLGELCPLCGPLDGQVATKPPFEVEFPFFGPIPGEIEEALLEDGMLRLELDNGFNFDPIRPGPDPGAIRVTLDLILRLGAGP